MMLNKKTIDSLTLPKQEKPYAKIFHDSKLKGFAIRVTSNGAKTFVINKKLHGKVLRMNIGSYGVMTAEDARKKAYALLGEIAGGRDPSKESEKQPARIITLQQAFDDYLDARKSLKPNSRLDYQSIIKNVLNDWSYRPLNSITREMVGKLHSKVGEKSPSRANNAFKLLSAVFNFALYQYQNEQGEYIIKENPVMSLTQTRAWYKKKRRITKIDNYDLPSWFKAVNSLPCQTFNSIEVSVKYYLILLLFTGLRREEAATLIWSEEKSQDEAIAKTEHLLDLKNKTIYIPDPKNGVDHWLPLSNYLYDVFAAYRKINQSRYVFPGAGKASYIKEPRKVMDKITEATGVRFTSHDLRRTFASLANEAGVPAYTLKRLLNHKSGGSDVTAGYIISDLQYLKEPMQKVTDYILTLINK